METHRGHFQEHYGHPDVLVSANPTYRSGAEWVLGYFEQQIRSGVVFRSGENVQIGWMTAVLEAAGSGELEVLEPEFGSLPIKWVRGVNSTVRHLMIQKEVCDQLGVEVAYPSMRQSGIVSPSFLSDHEEFELSREKPRGNDSGWIFCERGYSGSSGTLCSLYQIASAVPAVIPLLALPSGSVVKRSKSSLEVSAFNSTISSADNNFLKRLLESTFFLDVR